MKASTKQHRLLCLILCLAVCLSFAACGSSGSAADTPSIAGTYTLYGIAVPGDKYIYAVSDALEAGVEPYVLEMKANGKLTLTIDGEAAAGKWTLDGDVLTISDSSDSMTGGYDGAGVLWFGNEESGTMYFAADGADTSAHPALTLEEVMNAMLGGNTGDASAAAEQPEAGPSEEDLPEELRWWNGDWYGWWIIQDATGDYEELNGSWWDCIATIAVTDPDTGAAELTVWDEEATPDAPTGVIELTVTAADRAVTESGYMWVDEIEHADWIIYPTIYNCNDIFVVDTGSYDGNDGSFSYFMFLRPWGESWDDIIADSGSLPFDDMTPYNYESWYLPLIEAGSAMPDTVGGEAVTASAASVSAEPAAAAAPAETASTDVTAGGEVTGDGVISHEKLAGLFKWLRTIGDFTRVTTYQDICDAVGAPGKQQGTYNEEYRNFVWTDGGYAAVDVTFYASMDWAVGAYTTGLSEDEIAAADISSFPVLGETNGMKTVTGTVTGASTDLSVTMTIPDEFWYLMPSGTGLYIKNAPTEDLVDSTCPYIRVQAKNDVTKFDFYKDKFKNYTELGTETIDGIEFTVRTYDFSGSIKEYVGVLDGKGISVSFDYSRLDPAEGDTADTVIHSMHFSFG